MGVFTRHDLPFRRTVGRPTNLERLEYEKQELEARKQHAEDEEKYQKRRKVEIEEKLAKMKRYSLQEYCADPTKRELREEKVKDILDYKNRTAMYEIELKEEFLREQKKSRNQRKNRGKKSSQYFVFEKILELIELYIDIYQLDREEQWKLK